MIENLAGKDTVRGKGKSHFLFLRHTHCLCQVSSICRQATSSSLSHTYSLCQEDFGVFNITFNYRYTLFRYE